MDTAIEWLAGQIGVTAGGVSGPPQKKDGGVDVVTWRPFTDGRTAIPLLLAQCTIRRDFEDKGRDISANQWMNWLVTGCPPLTALTIPFAVPLTMNRWNDDMRFATHLILDRLRLCELIEHRPPLDHTLANSLATWTEEQIVGLRFESCS